MILHINKQTWVERLRDLCSATPDNFSTDFERIQFINLREQTKNLWDKYGKTPKSDEEVLEDMKKI